MRIVRACVDSLSMDREVCFGALVVDTSGVGYGYDALAACTDASADLGTSVVGPSLVEVSETASDIRNHNGEEQHHFNDQCDECGHPLPTSGEPPCYRCNRKCCIRPLGTCARETPIIRWRQDTQEYDNLVICDKCISVLSVQSQEIVPVTVPAPVPVPQTQLQEIVRNVPVVIPRDSSSSSDANNRPWLQLNNLPKRVGLTCEYCKLSLIHI